MRKPNQITVDRALLLYVLHLAEPHGLLSDVKLQQLCFLCELQMFGKGFKGFHFEFFRFAYGAFSKDLDNDLTVAAPERTGGKLHAVRSGAGRGHSVAGERY